MYRICTFFILFFLIEVGHTQEFTLTGLPLKSAKYPALESQFKAYQVYEMDVASFNAFAKSAGTSFYFKLQLENMEWDIWLEPRDIRSPNYVLEALTAEGVQVLRKGGNITYRGFVAGAGGGRAALTIDHDFIYGFIPSEKDLYFIEPLWYFEPGQPKNKFVVYASSNVLPKEGIVCGFEEMNNFIAPQTDRETNSPDIEKAANCYTAELAIASDLAMYNKYGSVAAVQNHNIAVMNNVQTNYDNEFADNIQFSIVENFVVTPPASDPWTSSTNSSTLLSSFRSWGPSGFSQTHDIGQLWTNRDLNDNVVGIAYLGAVCSSFRYHCLQDFTSNADFLRVLTSHEIGHNFDADHDASGSPTIMAPSVNNTNTWSSQSVNAINAYIQLIDPPGGCLSTCGGGGPSAPVVNFTATPQTGCASLTVNYTDLSSNNPTSWSWSFPGGSPSSSTQQFPTVTYASPGTYNATLTASNSAGSNTLIRNSIVTVSSSPNPNFTWSSSGLTIFFTNTSSNATSYVWNFGDGTPNSSLTNPSHSYSSEGYYSVTLTATNSCNSVPVTYTIAVFAQPVAAFSGSPTSGCAPLIVSFTNQSSANTTTLLWSFPGGTPSTSNLPNPVVTYNTPGSYQVNLTASNPGGSNTSAKPNFVSAGSIPLASFSFSVNGNTASFTNTSTGATSYSWNFGDGTPTSNQANPSHVFVNDGTYQVVLTAINSCGSTTQTRSVTVQTPPTAGFTANPTNGCATFQVAYNNTSSANATGYSWSFPGGTPSTSNAVNPTVTYQTPGVYNATLVASNGAGSNTHTKSSYISVNPLPTSNFTSTVNGLSANFTNTSSNATSYSWNFGDGTFSTSSNPSHSYNSDGNYTVTLNATNNCGTVSTSKTVSIITPPVAAFAATTLTGCASLAVQFINQSTANASSYSWSFPGGTPSTSTAQSPTVVYAAKGIYSVTLTVGNAAGNDTQTEINYISVNDKPTVDFASSTNGFTATFTNNSTNASSYSWNFGDGSALSNAASPTHTYTNDGVYTVILSATNECGTTTQSKQVTVVTPPSAGFSASTTSGCATLTVQFNNASSANASSYSWEFPGGTPATSTQQNPVVTYAAIGNYTVKLTAANTAGNHTSTQTDYVKVTSVPAAGFNFSTDIFEATFTNTSINPPGASPVTYVWDFGDGQSSTQTNPVHNYTNDGTYTVKLTATNGCGSTTATQNVVIISPPTAGFSANTFSGCSPLTVQFSDESSPNTTSWQWSFPGGTPATSTQQNPVVTYPSAGAYNVSLIAANALSSDALWKAGYITVGKAPEAAFISSANLLSASFTNNTVNPDASGPISYLWDFGDGQTSTSENPVHAYAEDGVYTVSLTATNSCGFSVTNKTVTVVTPPTAGFTASQVAGCAPLTVQFSNQSSANSVSYEWQFPGGTPSSSTEQNPVVIYSSPDIYSASLKVTNAAGSHISQQNNLISVGNPPEADYSAAVNGTVATFSNNSFNPNGSSPVSYSWDFGDGKTSTDANPVHDFGTDGIYTVMLTATNNCGSGNFSKTVTIVTPPTAGFTFNVAEGCVPLTVQFSNQSSANSTGFEWQFPGGAPSSSTEQNPVVVYSSPNIYGVSLTVSNAAGNHTLTQNDLIAVGNPPQPGFTLTLNGTAGTFNNNTLNLPGAGPVSYSWDFGDGGNSTAENPVHDFGTDGVYTVTLTAMNNCGATATTQTATVITPPTAGFSALVTGGCVPFTVQFNNESSANATGYLWRFEGVSPDTSTAKNPTVTYSQPGTFSVMLIAYNAAGGDTTEIASYISAITIPSAGFSFTTMKDSVFFTNNSSLANTYLWDFGNGSTSTAEDPVHKYTGSGEYQVTLTAFNECGFASATRTLLLIFTGVEDIPGIEQFHIFPNPSNGIFSLSLTGQPKPSLELSFTNILGQKLLAETFDFRSGSYDKVFDFGDLPAGMYLFTLRAGQKALYRKVVIE